jgi:hypothetical protein
MNYLMQLLAAVGWAAIAAYAGNVLAFQVLGGARAAVTVVPWVEEACKLAAALMVPGTPMLLVHLLFGAVESGHDLWRGREDAWFFAVLTFSGHGLFGSLAMLSLQWTGSVWWAYGMAGMAHTAYNLAVLYLVLPTLGAGPGVRR